MKIHLQTWRIALIGAAGCVSSMAMAQIVAPTAHQTINQVFSNLHAQRDIDLNLVGTDRSGSSTTPFSTRILWHQVGDGDQRTLKLSLRRIVNGNLVFEARANGSSIIAYDYANRTYTATPYHRVKDPQTPNLRDEAYTSRLLATLLKISTSNGPDSYAARLVSEALGDPAGQFVVDGFPISVQYRSWMPSRAAFELPATLPPTTYPDPVLPKEIRLGYTPTENDRFFVYNGAPKRSIVFHTYQVDPAGSLLETNLYAVYFGERSQIGSRQRLVEWAMAVTTPTPTAPDFEDQFEPYTNLAGWRPLAMPGSPKLSG